MRWPRYEQMKASGVAWLGEVPGHWDVKRLKFASELINDKVERLPADASYVGLENVESETGRWVDSESEPGGESQSLAFASGDVLFGKLRPYLAKSFLATSDGCCSSEFLVLRGRSLLPTYLRYWCASNHFVSVVDGSTYGSKMPRADPAFIASLLCMVPPLDEQRAIAAFLDRETTRIDALVAAKRRLIALLQEKRAALIARAVTRGLDPDVPTKDSGVAWLGRVPAHWRVGKCGHYMSVLSGFAFPSSGFTANESDTRLLRGVNVGVSRVRWDDVVYWERLPGKGLDTYELREGDIVIGMDRPLIGEGVRVARLQPTDAPCLLLQRVAKLQPGPRLLGEYLMQLLSSPMFVPHFSPDTTGVSVPHISPEQIGNFVVPIPPMPEQAAIAELLTVQGAHVGRAIAAAQQGLDRLTEYRSTLITSVVTGRIDVRAAA